MSHNHNFSVRLNIVLTQPPAISVFAAFLVYVYGLKKQWWEAPRWQRLDQSDPDGDGVGS